MMRFSWVASYESDTQPVETVRGKIEADSSRQALRRAVRRAIKSRPRQRRFRSWVIVIERLDEVGEHAAVALDPEEV